MFSLTVTALIFLKDFFLNRADTALIGHKPSTMIAKSKVVTKL